MPKGIHDRVYLLPYIQLSDVTVCLGDGAAVTFYDCESALGVGQVVTLPVPECVCFSTAAVGQSSPLPWCLWYACKA